MSLKLQKVIDAQPVIETVRAYWEDTLATNVPYMELEHPTHNITQHTRGNIIYLQGQHRAFVSKMLSPVTNRKYMMCNAEWDDPDTVVNGSPVDTNGPWTFFPGCYDPDTGLSNLYAYGPTSSAYFTQHSTTNLGATNTDIFNPWQDPLVCLGFSSGTPGHWRNGVLYGGSTMHSMAVYFDKAFDGWSGITAKSGANVYPKGLFMMMVGQGTYLTSGDADWAYVFIDPVDSLIQGILPVESGATGGSATWDGPKLDVQNFLWNGCQFVADPVGHTAAAPKGELHLWCIPNYVQGGSITQTYPIVYGTNGVDRERRMHVKVIDFNPTNSTTGVTRVHGREIRRSYLITPLNPYYDGFTALPTSGLPEDASTLYYNPVNRTYGSILSIYLGGTRSKPIATDQWAFASFSSKPSTDLISGPSPIGGVEKNARSTITAVLRGDFGESVSGSTATAVLNRASTYGELLDTSGAPATNTVANFPIDDSSLVVYENGTPLVDPTDYTVVESTGVITWAGSHPNGGNVYTVDYEHRSTPVQPPHGTLISAEDTSDSNGVVRFDVEYDDAVDVGVVDQLTVTVDD